MKLDLLLLKYQTDKNYGVMDATKGHTYGKTYHEIFDKFDRWGKHNILEIGIQRGGSLLAWSDFFNNANIYGVDILDSILPEYRYPNRFNYIFDDIKSNAVTEQLKDVKFDIIIDDGSHFLEDVLFVVKTYLNHLNPNGVMIIEDCQNPEYWFHEIEKLLPNGFKIESKDLRAGNSYDNYMIIISRV